MANLSFDDLIPAQSQAGGGLSFDDLVPPNAAEKAPPQREVSRLESAVRGAGQGASFGLADEVQGAAAAGGGFLPHQIGAGLGRMALEWAAPSLFGNRATESYNQTVTADREGNRLAREQNPGTYLAGELGGGLAGGAGIVRAGGSLAANAVARGAPLNRVAVGSAIDGALLGGVSGAASGETLEQRGLGAATGAGLGGLIGGAVPYITSGATSAFRRAVSPMNVTPERRAAADVLQREGVELTAGQISGNRTLRFKEAEMGGARMAERMEQQAEQFTSAALRRAGIDAPRATPEVLQGASNRIGQVFDDIGSRNALVADREFANDLADVFRTYGYRTPESQRAPIVQKLGADIVNGLAGGNRMPGDVYNGLASTLAREARAAGADTNLSKALYGLREALDDALERSMKRAGSEDMPALLQARREWRNLVTLEKAAGAAGENAALGLISPSALRNATATTQGRRNYVHGRGDFADLARAGEALMKPLPDSGTAGRLRAQGLTTLMPTIFGAGAGGAYGSQNGPEGAMIGALAGAAAPWAMGRALTSAPIQNYLTNQALPGSVSPEIRQFLDMVGRHSTIPGAQRGLLPGS